jgi:hypothetical protein
MSGNENSDDPFRTVSLGKLQSRVIHVVIDCHRDIRERCCDRFEGTN